MVGVYVLIANIPEHFHTNDLRSHFSLFIEGNKFLLFHYRHRPIPSLKEFNLKLRIPPAVAPDTCCVIVKINEESLQSLCKTYGSKNWTNRNGETIGSKCVIIPFGSLFDLTVIESFKELKPPLYMTNGNVGTTTKHFLKLIQKCLLPASLIKKLGLEFPKTKYWRKYGNVKFEYTGSENQNDSDDCDTEEWDRHETLANDVTSQDRIKERLYEEELEVVWEKGGSGLVFYTDAQYWDEKEGDFDEKTSDYWDVDMSCYYEDGAGDKDAQDMLSLRREQRYRHGTCQDSIFSKPTTPMLLPKKFSKRKSKSHKVETSSWGIGKKVLVKQGWREGQGLGRQEQGMSTALECEGQKCYDKRGIGYRGVKLDRFIHHKKPKRDPYDVIITTKYDLPADTDPPDTLMRINPPTYNKNR